MIAPEVLFVSIAVAGVAIFSRVLRGSWIRWRIVTRVQTALIAGNDLLALGTTLESDVQDAYLVHLESRSGAASGLEEDLRIAYAAVAIELGRVELAVEQLTHLGAAVDAEIIEQRVALVRGDAPRELTSRTPVVFHQLLARDTQAQIAIANRDPASALAMSPILPTTIVRALVAAGQIDEAVTRIGTIATARLDAMTRLFPADAATLLIAKLRAGPTPYRS